MNNRGIPYNSWENLKLNFHALPLTAETVVADPELVHGPGPGPNKTVPKQLKHFQLNKHISQPLRGKISRTCVFQ